MDELYSKDFQRYNLKCSKHEGARNMKVVVLISASAEWNGVKPLFPKATVQNTPYGESMNVMLESHHLTLLHSGWGKIASAGALQYVIDHYKPDLVVNLVLH